MLEGDQNDPRVGFPLDTAQLIRTPVYIRFEPVGSNANWNLRSAWALVYTGAGQFFTSFGPPDDFDDLWLGHDSARSSTCCVTERVKSRAQLRVR